MRIGAGEARGRRIRVPHGADVRPTADRVRSALFDILGGRVAGAEVLDLYAGSGALGLEALSRGARACVFVDRHPACTAVVRENAASLGFAGRVEVRRGEAVAAARALLAEGRSFDLVFLDPPYGAGRWGEVLPLLAAGLLRPGGWAVAEHAPDERLPDVPGLRPRDARRYGDTALTFLEREQARRDRGPAGESCLGREGGGVEERRALCPGTFDPITNGHVDIIERAARLFSLVYVTIFPNPDKRALFTVEERLEMTREALAGLGNVVVDAFDGLVTEYARLRGVRVVVRGLRAITDFEYEFQMAQMNMRLNPELETCFIMTRPEHAFLSSSIIKTVARFGGSVAGLVPPAVEERLLRRLREEAGGAGGACATLEGAGPAGRARAGRRGGPVEGEG